MYTSEIYAYRFYEIWYCIVLYMKCKEKKIRSFYKKIRDNNVIKRKRNYIKM